MKHHSQRGGTLLGFIIGLVMGLGVALAVAVYVTKVPTPFSNKNTTRSTDQDAQETQKNKEWNPNGVLQPKPPVEAPSAPAPGAANDNAAVAPQAPNKPEPKQAVTADPLGDLAQARSGLSTPATAAAADPFDYVLQVGAYRTSTDADAQKAKLALMGLDAKVSEREQAGRSVFRVRLGPYADKVAAERVRVKLEDSGIDNTLVRVQR